MKDKNNSLFFYKKKELKLWKLNKKEEIYYVN